MVRAAINASRASWRYVFPAETVREFQSLLEFDADRFPEDEAGSAVDGSVAAHFADAEVILSTWGAVPLDQSAISRCPNLKLVLHAAGTVKGFVTEELIRRGVVVSSAVQQNARPVAEFTLGLILTSLKNVYQHSAELRRLGPAAWEKDGMNYPGGYFRTKVGIIGDGTVARILLRLLRNFEFDVCIDSDYYTENDQATYFARKAPQAEIMATCDVISLHHADIPKYWKIINRENLSLLKPGARIINTARGRLIDEAALADRLRKGDVTAYLDVTHPEPPRVGHPFYELPNCFLTPHIAGSIGREVHRMSQFMLAELQRFLQGMPLEGAVDLVTLADRA